MGENFKDIKAYTFDSACDQFLHSSGCIFGVVEFCVYFEVYIYLNVRNTSSIKVLPAAIANCAVHMEVCGCIFDAPGLAEFSGANIWWCAVWCIFSWQHYQVNLKHLQRVCTPAIPRGTCRTAL